MRRRTLTYAGMAVMVGIVLLDVLVMFLVAGWRM